MLCKASVHSLLYRTLAPLCPMEGLEEDIKEVDSLLSVAVRPLVRGRLALLLSDLQQVQKDYLLYRLAV